MNIILFILSLLAFCVGVGGIYIICKNETIKKTEGQAIVGKKISVKEMPGTPYRYIVKAEYKIDDSMNEGLIITPDKAILQYKDDEALPLIYVKKKHKVYYAEEKSYEVVVKVAILGALCFFALNLIWASFNLIHKPIKIKDIDSVEKIEISIDNKTLSSLELTITEKDLIREFCNEMCQVKAKRIFSGGGGDADITIYTRVYYAGDKAKTYMVIYGNQILLKEGKEAYRMNESDAEKLHEYFLQLCKSKDYGALDLDGVRKDLSQMPETEMDFAELNETVNAEPQYAEYQGDFPKELVEEFEKILLQKNKKGSDYAVDDSSDYEELLKKYGSEKYELTLDELAVLFPEVEQHREEIETIYDAYQFCEASENCNQIYRFFSEENREFYLYTYEYGGTAGYCYAQLMEKIEGEMIYTGFKFDMLNNGIGGLICYEGEHYFVYIELNDRLHYGDGIRIYRVAPDATEADNVLIRCVPEKYVWEDGMMASDDTTEVSAYIERIKDEIADKRYIETADTYLYDGEKIAGFSELLQQTSPHNELVQMWFYEIDDKVYTFQIFHMKGYNYMLAVRLVEENNITTIGCDYIVPRFCFEIMEGKELHVGL